MKLYRTLHPALVGAFLLMTAAGFAQSVARLDGTVTDSTQAVIPACHVIVTNQETGVKSSALTNGSGLYVFAALAPGHYQVAFSHDGFQTVTSDLILYANDRKGLNISLSAAGTDVKIEVTAPKGVVATTDSGQKSETLTSEQIKNFSTIGRNAEELLTLLPGITLGGGKAFGQNFDPHQVGGGNPSGGIEGFNVNGNRNDFNTFKLDGGNLDDLTGNNGSGLYPNSNFISELTVTTANYTADQGGSPVVVTAITTAGTKSFHGSAYWTGRNSSFDANDWSSNNAGLKRPESKFNYPGFSFGGPVLIPGTSFNRGTEKKMFFFVGTEWSRQTPDSPTELVVVPSAKMLTGDFTDITTSAPCQAFYTAFIGNPNAPDPGYLHQPCHISDPLTGKFLDQQGGQLTGITANGQGLLKQLMGPNFQGPTGLYTDASGQWNFAGRPVKPHNVTQYIGRFDYAPSDKARFFVRLGRQDETIIADYGEYSAQNSGWTSNIPEPTSTLQVYNSRSISVNMVNVLNPTLTNEFSFSAAVLRQPNYYQDAKKLYKSNLGVTFQGAKINGAYPANNYPIVPQITGGYCSNGILDGCLNSPPGASRTGTSNLVGAGNGYKNTTFEFGDNVTKALGKHTLKFGGLVERAREDQSASNPLEGVLQTGFVVSGTHDQFADILTEHFTGYSQTDRAPTGFFRFTNLEWYAQDNWKVTRNLTLELGIRWSWLVPWSEASGQAYTFDPSAFDPTIVPDPNNLKSVYNGIRTASCKNPGQSDVPLCGTIPNTVVGNEHPVTQPRIGFAWDAFHSGRLVLRGGVGQYTARDQGNANQSVIGGPPNLFNAALFPDSGTSITLAQIENGDVGHQTFFNFSQPAWDRFDKSVPAVYQYNLTLSNSLPHKLFAEMSYVGSASRHLLITKDINAIPLGAAWACFPNCSAANADHTIASPDNLDVYRPRQPLSSIPLLSHSSNANYNSLQTSFRRTAGHGLDFLAAYTFSKALGESDYYGTPLLDPFVRKNNRRILTFDQTHVFTLGYQYYVPSLARGALHDSKIARAAFGGWLLTGITRLHSGGPLAIATNVNCRQATGDPTNPYGDCNSNVWQGGASWFGSNAYQGTLLGNVNSLSGILPVFTCDPVNHNHNGLKNSWINDSCIGLPNFGQQGAFRPPYIKTPGYQNWDMALQKSFKLSESKRVDVRISSFDITNRAQLNTQNAIETFLLTLPQNASQPTDGTITKTTPSDSAVGLIVGKTGHREMEANVTFVF